MSTIGKRLEEFGSKKFDSQREFADAWGIAPASLSRFINDLRIPSLKLLRKLKELGADTDYILNGERDQPNKVPEGNATLSELVSYYRELFLEKKKKVEELEEKIKRLENK